jgi:hypothetical protein
MMRRIVPGLALMLAAGSAALADDKPSHSDLTKGEEQLAKLLEGRIAGEKIECMPPARNLPSQTIPQTAIVFGRPSSSVIYVQRTRAPQMIDRDSFLVSLSGQPNRFCRMDQFNMVDRVLGLPIGAVVFDHFIPYTRAKGDE